MTNKVYLVTYNTDNNFNNSVFYKHISTVLYPQYISDWWHYLENVYIVISSLDVNQIYNLISPQLGGRNLLIIEINPNNAQGWLPKKAWEWIQKYQIR